MNSQKLALVSAVAAALVLSACSSSSRVSGTPDKSPLIKAENNVILPETLESKTFLFDNLENQTQAELQNYVQRKYAEDRVALPGAVEVEDYSVSINQNFYKNKNGGFIELKSLLGGGNTISINEDAKLKVGNNRYDATRTTNGIIYQTQYSIVGGLDMTGYSIGGVPNSQGSRLITSETPHTYRTIEMLMKGFATQKMPLEGRAVYTGSGVDSNGVGSGGWGLTYTVDFDDKSGFGLLKTGVLGGEATVELLKSHFGNSAKLIHTNRLDNTQIKGFGISGAAVAKLTGGEEVERLPFPVLPSLGSNSVADADNAEAIKAWNEAVIAERKANARSSFYGNGSYDLAFFGPNAEEISGLAKLKYHQSYEGVGYLGEKSIAFGGVRGSVSTATATTSDAAASGATPANP